MELTPTRQRLLLAAVMSGLLLAMLDQTIVGTALPEIVRRLGGDSLYVWVVTAYLVPATVSIPIYARLSDRYGRRALLLVGMVIFLLGSGLSAASQTMEQLVAFRAVQGLGAGALEGLTFILVADLYSGRRSAALQGALAGLMGVSFILGPLLGGFIADSVGWRWVFLVNLPIGLAALTVVATVLPASIGRSEDRRMPLDLKGIALLTLAIGLVLVGLSEREVVLLVAGLVPLAAFIVVERGAAAPIIPPALFAERRTGAILVAGAFGAFGMFASLLLLPRYFQDVEGASATHSGVLIYPLLIGLIVSVNVAGGVIAKRGEYRTVVLGGMVLLVLGALGFATFDASTPKWASLTFMALIGLGVGPQLSGLQIAMMRTVEPHRIAGGLGSLMLLRQVGAAVALAAAETMYVRGEDPAVAVGTSILVIALVGAAIASAALLSVPRPATRFAVLAS